MALPDCVSLGWRKAARRHAPRTFDHGVPLSKNPIRETIGNLIRADPYHRLVFTYSDLMNREIIGDLCPDPEFVTVATAPAFRFIINRDGIATIIPTPDSVVYGVVWQIDEIALVALDICMGMPTFFERAGGFKLNIDGKLIVSEHYVAREVRSGEPKSSYLETIVKAAKDHGFPPSYVEELLRWHPGFRGQDHEP
jgi:hypothetical protein